MSAVVPPSLRSRIRASLRADWARTAYGMTKAAASEVSSKRWRYMPRWWGGCARTLIVALAVGAGGSRARRQRAGGEDRQAFDVRPASTAAATTSDSVRKLNGLLSTRENPSVAMTS
jgi:hypothetical protein